MEKSSCLDIGCSTGTLLNKISKKLNNRKNFFYWNRYAKRND